MSISYLAGVCVGVLVALLIGFCFYLIGKKNGTGPMKYDERQLMARGNGFKIGFFVLLIYNFLYGVIDTMTDVRFCDTMTGIMIGLCLALVSYAGYCIWKDAYLSLNEKPKTTFLIFGMVGVMNLLIGIMNILHENIIENHILTYRITNFLVGITFILLFIIYGVKMFVTRNEEE